MFAQAGREVAAKSPFGKQIPRLRLTPKCGLRATVVECFLDEPISAKSKCGAASAGHTGLQTRGITSSRLWRHLLHPSVPRARHAVAPTIGIASDRLWNHCLCCSVWLG
jgi:hypothetical protein